MTARRDAHIPHKAGATRRLLSTLGHMRRIVASRCSWSWPWSRRTPRRRRQAKPAVEGLLVVQAARRLRARGCAAHGRRRRRDAARRAGAADARVTTPPIAPPGRGRRHDRRRRRPAPPRRPVSAEGGAGAGGAAPDFSGTNTQEIDVDEPDILKTDGTRDLRRHRPHAARDRRRERHRDRHARARRQRPQAAAARQPAAGDRQPRASRRLRADAAGRPGRADRSPAASQTRRSSPRSTSPPRRRSCARWRSPARSSTRARTAPRAAGDQRRAAADRPAEGEPVDDAVEDATLSEFLGRTDAQEQPQRPHVQAQPRAVRRGHPPGAVLGPGRAGDPDDRPRPRHVLARPRRRDGRRAGRLRLGRRLYVASRRYVRALELGDRRPRGHRAPRSTASTSPTRRRRSTGPAARSRASSSTTTRSPSSTGELRVATTEEPPWFQGGRPAEQPEPRDRAATRQGNKLMQVGAVSGLGKGERIYAVRFMGEQGLRRHVPPGRPAVHARPVATRPRRRSSAS